MPQPRSRTPQSGTNGPLFRGVLCPRRAPILVFTALAAVLPGCRLPWLGLGNEFRVESSERPVVLEPGMRHRVYTSPGRNAADIYITDIDPERLAPDRPLTGVSGSLLHVHMFVEPYPGRTPIEPTALSATARLVIAADGEVGVYEGAGFLLPDNSPSGDRFSGAIRGGTLRLTASTPGFVDQLGPAVLDLSFSARRDPEAADVIDQAIEDFRWRATSFPQPTAPTPTPTPTPAPTSPAEPTSPSR